METWKKAMLEVVAGLENAMAMEEVEREAALSYLESILEATR